MHDSFAILLVPLQYSTRKKITTITDLNRLEPKKINKKTIEPPAYIDCVRWSNFLWSHSIFVISIVCTIGAGGIARWHQPNDTDSQLSEHNRLPNGVHQAQIVPGSARLDPHHHRQCRQPYLRRALIQLERQRHLRYIPR